MKQKRIYSVLLLVSFLMCVSGTAIYALPEASVINRFETGNVDIRIDEYSEVDGKKTKSEKRFENILPGQFLSNIPVITNQGSECYIRVKPVFEGTDFLSGKDLEGITDDWIWAEDGFLYYKKTLSRGEKISVFQGIRIPDDFPQEDMQEKEIKLYLQADSIQSANFQPDFSEKLPWGQVEILTSKKTDQYHIRSLAESENTEFKIEYQGNMKAMIIEGDDFFANFPALMPGDTYGDNISLENSELEEMKFYFKSEIIRHDEILRKIKLSIITDIEGQKKVVYQGPLEGTEITDSILLGQISQKEKGKFSFMLSVPEELNNDYTQLSSCVKWIFSTEEIPESVQTGDSGIFAYALIGGGISLGVMTVMSIKYKKHVAKRK